MIRFIFSSSVGRAEFQRQVVLPNVVKFSQALVEIIGKYESEKLKVRATFDLWWFSDPLLIPSRGPLLRDPLPAGLALPLLTQTAAYVIVRAHSQASKRFIARSVIEKTRYCCFEALRRSSMYGWESWCLELVEEIHRRNFGVRTRRTLLAED